MDGYLVSVCYQTTLFLLPQEDFMNRNMTENEKKLLQAKHRLEEAEMRDRNKERKARTRRLIQEGAILEKVFPSVASMSLDDVEDFLCGLKR